MLRIGGAAAALTLSLGVLADNAASGNAPAAHSASAAAVAPRLDLSAPPVSHVFTPGQIESFIDDREATSPEDVSVETPRYATPVPRGTFRALPWAFMHPMQAWRIFTPILD